MLAAFLLALTLSSETPLKPLTTGAPPQKLRSVGGVTAVAGGGWLVAWSDGSTISIASAGADGQPTGNRKSVPGIDAALGTTSKGPILLWTAANGTFAAPLANDGSFRAPASRISAFGSSPLELACNANGCIAVTGNTYSLLDADAQLGAQVPGDPILAAAADPSGFLLVRRGASTLRAERIDQQTAAVTASTPLPNSPTFLAVARADFDGQRYAVIYPNKDSGDLVGATMDLDGTLGQAQKIYSVPLGLQGMAFVWNGSEHLFAVGEITQLGNGFETTLWPSALRVKRFDRNLAQIGATITLQDAPDSSYDPQVAGQGGRFYVAWQHYAKGGSVRAAQLTGADVTQAIFTTGLLSQADPVLAPAEDRDLALWTETDDALSRQTLFYRRFPQDAEARVLATAATISRPAAAANGSDWLAVWMETQGYGTTALLKGAIVSPFADDIQRIDITTNRYARAIASAANGWVLLVTNGGTLQSIRVTRAGQVLPAVDVMPNGNGELAFVSNGTNFFVATADSNRGVDLALLDENGALISSKHLDIDKTKIYNLAAATMRRGFLLAVSSTDSLSFYRIGSDLSVSLASGTTGSSAQELWLAPYGSGFLATLDANAYLLDANGVNLGPPTALPLPVVALAPHGIVATALFSKLIEAQPVNARQLVRRELFDQQPANGRRRALH